MRAGHGETPVENVCGHRVDVVVVGDRDHPLHFLGAVVGGEEGGDVVAWQAHLGGEFGEHLYVADVEAVAEIGPQQAFLQCRLVTGGLGQEQQTMGEQGVGPKGAVHVELDTLGGGQFGHVPYRSLRGLRPAELAGIRVGHRHGLSGRGARVELVWAVDDVQIDLVGQQRCGPLETALADVAPRADDIAPDFDEESGPHDEEPIVTVMSVPPADVQATFCATLVDEWVRLGLRQAVIAPGSRSTPLALAFAARDDIGVQVAHDERAAAFIALGVGLASGVPAAVLCTSGTAATHFHAAVVEADLASVPLLVLTADRPPELHGIGAPQTIDQVDLYGAVVRCFADPGVPDATDRGVWREWAADWWLSAVDADPGPVHVNLAFREPLVGVAGELPAAPVAVPAIDPDEWFMMRPDMAELAAVLSASHGLVVAGRGVDDPQVVGELAARLGWPVLADALSGCRHLSAAVCAFDSLLRVPAFAAAHRPQVVLHLGEPPASKVLGQWLAASGAAQVHVHPQQRVVDPLQMITERVYGRVSTVCGELLGAVTPAPDGGWNAAWRAGEDAAQRAVDAALGANGGLTEPAVARWLSTYAGSVVTSSSMPVRDLEWFGRPSTTSVYSNRGANGIDGVLSTGIGVALATGRPTVVHIGDVALLHDQSALTALAARRLPLTIVVTDNDGGAIFSFLPQATQLPAGRFEQLFGTPHGTDLVALAQAHGLGAVDASDEAGLRVAVDDPQVTLVRVRTTRTDNVAVHARLNAAVAAAIA